MLRIDITDWAVRLFGLMLGLQLLASFTGESRWDSSFAISSYLGTYQQAYALCANQGGQQPGWDHKPCWQHHQGGALLWSTE
jgi:hypothetical protein